jgi:ribonuclease HI
MEIEGAVYGYATKDFKAFGVGLKSGDFEHKRVMSLKDGSANAAELHAVEYALLAMDPSVRNANVIITTRNAYAPRMLAKDNSGEYKSKPEKNVDLIEAVRKTANLFEHLTVVSGKTDLLDTVQAEVRGAKNDVGRAKE